MNRVVCIVQARYNSTRLPGKVLLPLNDSTVLEHVLTRCMNITGVDDVCCATTISPLDDPVASEADRHNVSVYRGSEADVLGRYAEAASFMNADVIMRVTADCPLIDPGVCADALSLYFESKADFATNNKPPTWPHGLDCEIFGKSLLDMTAQAATDIFDREHVTPYIRRMRKLQFANLAASNSLERHRWTLDTPDDYAFLCDLFLAFRRLSRSASLSDVMKLLSTRPDLLARSQDPARSAAVIDTRQGVGPSVNLT